VSASALLTDVVPVADRANVQGLSDLLMGLMAALGSAAAGVVVATAGFAVLGIASGVLGVAIGALALVRRSEPVTDAGAGPHAG
jgi:MFS family permease